MNSNTSKSILFWLIVLAAFSSRYYKIDEPDHVCWDETHFGKMGSWYINRTFFFDVHPPLGKMLIAFSGYLSNYDGKFAFDKPGDKYTNTSYIGMRFFCASLGAAIVPIAYETVHQLTGSTRAALFSSLFLLCDIGLITLVQYILLDPILLFFIGASTLGLTKTFAHHHSSIFATKWWFWHFFTGFSLSSCICVKFVGLFTVLFAGLWTLFDLWHVLGDLSKPMSYITRYFMAKVLTLIVWPLLVYMVIFSVHLQVLNRSGNGDGFYSSAFQSQLAGNSMYNLSMPEKVAYGSIVTLKNHKIGGGYLHSHFHLYPEEVGPRQQQVTTYTYKDENNRWIIKKIGYYSDGSGDCDDDDADVKIVRDGDFVRFEHVSTRRNLHSHNHAAPLTKNHFQVSGYGENGTGDANDVWKVVLTSRNQNELRVINEKIQLVHYMQSCVLSTTAKQLPKWGFEQHEVTCNPNLRDPNSYWNIEENYYEKLEKVNVHVYSPSFWQKFLESHLVMVRGNAGLKPKEGEVTSKPWQWPFNLKGQFFSGGDHKIYLLGNPIIWWLNLLTLPLFLVSYMCVLVIERRRRIRPLSPPRSRKLSAGLFLLVGWSLHYLPFYLMSRILYYHHYFPALIFNSLLSGVLIDLVIDTVSRLAIADRFFVVHCFDGGLIAGLVYSFVYFAPLAYGYRDSVPATTNSTVIGTGTGDRPARWIETWDF